MTTDERRLALREERIQAAPYWGKVEPRIRTGSLQGISRREGRREDWVLTGALREMQTVRLEEGCRCR